MRKFTGWHMAGTMIGFFGVVIAVNVTMATYASTTFGGRVVDNSYVASQKFNDWLEEARAEAQLGWKAEPKVERGLLSIAATASGGALTGATVTAVAAHPLGRTPDVRLRLEERERGRYVATRALSAGRWRLHLRIERDGRHFDAIEDVHA